MKKKVGAYQHLCEVIKKEGIVGMYKGLQTGLIGTVVSFGIYFFWYRFFKNAFRHFTGKEQFSDLDVAIITALSGIINSLMTNPIWFINTRMTLAKEKKGVIQTVKDIFKAEGITAFYRGVLPNMVLIMNPIINFVIYENLKKWMLNRKFSLNFLQLMLISSIGKSIATLLTYPVLTVRVLL